MEPIFVSVSAFNSMSKQEQASLMARFSDPTFMSFIDKQEEAAREQLISLNPDEPEMTAEEFRQCSRDFRRIWLFWSEFRDLAKTWAARSTDR